MYNVKYFRQCPLGIVEKLAEGMYCTHPEPSKEFTLEEFKQAAAYATCGDSMLVCYDGDVPVGCITVSRIVQDPHFTGLGVHITNFVVPVHPKSRCIVLALMREFRETVLGLNWYSTTHRRSTYTLSTKYWRLHEQVG